MQDISVQELKQRKENGDQVVLIDVREPHEHDEFNIGGDNYPLGEIVAWSEELQIPVDSEIILYCRSGNRSGMAKSYLASKGFTSVRNLIGGMIAWQKQ